MWRRVLVACTFALIAGSGTAFAQGVTVSGTVADESKGMLPGVTVTAMAIDTGRQFTDVTTDRGEYRLVGLIAGGYKLTAELSGFAPTRIDRVDLLVGQNATIPFTLKLATVNESVTVTGASPLVEISQARVAGNVDRKQMEDLPIAGRNWQQLASMVKGVTANSIVNRPGVNKDSAFALNLDGQQINQALCCSSNFGQPGLTRDSIAEFQIITNLFDVTMGRSTGIQVQAISRSGTNETSGSFYGFFRSDKLNAPDNFTNTVLPYSNQQIGGTLGGPIRHNKLQYFVSYEKENEPNTAVIQPSALAGQLFSIPTKREVTTFLGRVDDQLSGKDHLTVRSGYWQLWRPADVSGHPSRLSSLMTDSNYTSATWARAGSSNRFHEVKFNYYHYHWLFKPTLPGFESVPEYVFPGLTIGPPWNYPEDWNEDFFTTRYDLTWHKSSHDFKIGVENRLGKDSGWWEARERGQMRFNALPSDAARRFTVVNASTPSQWDLTGLDALGQRYDIYYAQLGGGVDDKGGYSFSLPRPMLAGWVSDTWKTNNRLTLNLGLRYDVSWSDTYPPDLSETQLLIDNGRDGLQDYGYRNAIRDLNNVAPRVGFTISPSDRGDFIIRGGTGLYYSQPSAQLPIEDVLWNGQRVYPVTYLNDGKPGWVLDPTRGVTVNDIVSGKVKPGPQSISVLAQGYQFAYAWQNMIGFQKQLGALMAFDADLVHYKGYNEPTARDVNLFYDPATGLPKNPSTFGRPNPSYGTVKYMDSQGISDSMALAMSFRRRYHNHFQVGANYTLMFYKHDMGVSDSSGSSLLNPFDPFLDWASSSDYQRHTVRTYGILDLPAGLQVSGSFLYGSGNNLQTSTNVDPLGLGVTRIRRDLSIIPRNNYPEPDPWQSLDIRVSKDFRIVGSVKLTAIGEVFNSYNFVRYGYNTLETSANFGKPNSAGAGPRTGQLAFRVSF
jgi:Carboxypeptidase regulatory-like domain